MANVKIGNTTYSNVDNVQLKDADNVGEVTNWMQSDDFNKVLSGQTINKLYENEYLTVANTTAIYYFCAFDIVYVPNLMSFSTNVGYNENNNPTRLSCKKFIAPKLTTTGSQLTYFGSVNVVDFTDLIEVANYGFAGGSLTAIILRGDTVPTVGSPSAQSSNHPTVYVPSAMLTSYQNNAAWTSLVNDKGWTLTALEGSEYENPEWFRS